LISDDRDGHRDGWRGRVLAGKDRDGGAHVAGEGVSNAEKVTRHTRRRTGDEPEGTADGGIVGAAG
jgi:hypothetical protein